MNMTTEIRRTLSDPKPLYALAGAGDLAAAKLREAPALLTEAAATVTTLANRIAAEAPEQIAKVQTRLAEVQTRLSEVQTRLSEVPSTLAVDPRSVVTTLDPRTARESIRGVVAGVDTQALRDKAQTLALVQVGRVLEAAGKAVETYDELAERGKVVVERYRGAVDGSVEDVTVVVEQVVVEEPAPAEAEPKAAGKATPNGAKPKVEDAEVSDTPTATAKPQAPQAKKTTAAPRKRTAPASSAKSTKA
jgi:hypothetical protein